MHVPFGTFERFIQFLKNSSEHYAVGMLSVLHSLISCILQSQKDVGAKFLGGKYTSGTS
jgi:hypothetical protein